MYMYSVMYLRVGATPAFRYWPQHQTALYLEIQLCTSCGNQLKGVAWGQGYRLLCIMKPLYVIFSLIQLSIQILMD